MRRGYGGDEWANADDFERFYRAHLPRVRQFVARRVQEPDIDDVVVDTFTVAARRYDTLPTEAARQLGWLLGTARHTISNLHRSARRRRALFDRMRTLAPRTPTTAADVDEKIWRALDRLSDDDLTILQLVAWDGCTTGEIAAFLGCSPGAAKTRLSRAKGRLRSALGEVTADA